jgi:putative CocE/NonD family hydrolase
MRHLLVPALLCAVAVLPADAQSGATDTAWIKTTAMIPMRDGVRLHTTIYAPRGRSDTLPIIFVRTPYGVPERSAPLSGSFKELADDGYVFAFQDIRGRYGSEGQFVMMRPPRDRRDAKAIDESTDAYDAIEWLVRNVPRNNGKVGMLGVSYPGWLTVMAMLDPHPALKAVSPQASPADMFLGDDFHHNGAFRLSYGFEYAALMETSKENANFAFDKYDTYDWYLDLGPLSNAAKHVGTLPTWQDFVAHPNYDEFWRRQGVEHYLTRPLVPALHVAGWWDQEDFYGPVTIYEALEKRDDAHHNYLIVGPWNHGGWNADSGRKLGNIDFGSATAKWYRTNVQAPWFAYWLHGKGTLAQPEALVFEAGANTWRSYDSWPVKSGVSRRALYFHPNRRLSFEPPRAGADTIDRYLSDPAHPVPYRARPIQATYHPRGSAWYTWLTEDQRFVDGRPDVLTWKTEPLTEDVTIAGRVMAELIAGTSGTDADFIVKLIDVYPEINDADPKMGGYELMVSNEVLRGRFRRGFETPRPMSAGRAEPISIDLHTQAYRFGKGHRIMVQVQSSWFPLIDRNPQTFVPNIFEAKASDFRAATMMVVRSPASASRVVLPVVTPAPVP